MNTCKSNQAFDIEVARRIQAARSRAADNIEAKDGDAIAVDPIRTMLAVASVLREEHLIAITAASIADEAASPRSPEAEAAWQKVEIAEELDGEARHNVLRTTPTTPAGMLAYVDFVRSEGGFQGITLSERQTGAILDSVRAFAARLTPLREVDSLEVLGKLAEVRHLLGALFMMAGALGDTAQVNAFHRVVGLSLDALVAASAILEGKPKPETDAA